MSSLATRALDRAQELLPTKLRGTLMLRAWALVKVPMILWARPVVEELTPDRCVVRIPLRRRTKNHQNALYIGAYTVGADVAGGLLAMEASRSRKRDVTLIFKDMKAEFLARGEDDVWFTCEEGPAIRSAVEQAATTGERVNLPVRITATVPRKRGDRAIATFVLTLSLKRTAKKGA